MKKFGLSIPLALLLSLAGCSASAETLPPRPGDNGPALQAAIDRVAAAGGGTLQLERGTYDIAMPLYLRSGVVIAGRGRETILTNAKLGRRKLWLSATIFAGNLNPNSFSDPRDGDGYAPRPARRVSDREVMIERCDEEEVAALPGRIVWLSTEAGYPGRRERINPEYGELTRAVRVSGCQVELEDAIRAPAGRTIRIHWSDGSRAVPAGEANRPIHDAGLRDLQLVSGVGQAFVASGCYKCSFTDLHIGESRRLLAVQGVRHSVFRNITGYFSERGVEFAQYAMDNIVENIDGEVRNPIDSGVKPAIRFGEFARDNVARNITLRLGEAYMDKTKLRFDPSANNKLENVKLVLPRPDGESSFLSRKAGEARATVGTLPPGTVLDNVRVCFEDGSPCEPL